jgi:hypothetical protein
MTQRIFMSFSMSTTTTIFLCDNVVIDFTSELLKDEGGQGQEETVEGTGTGTATETELCLITQDRLDTATHIQLECGHRFNYVPLFRDLVNYKQKFQSMEFKILRPHEIRCPYCRQVQATLLPYYELDGVSLVEGVNYLPDDKKLRLGLKLSSFYAKCEYIEPKHPEKGAICWHLLVSPWEDGKHYCMTHEKLMEKQKIREMKLAAKEVCQEVLKRGVRKGETCGMRARVGTGRCARHAPCE